MNTIEHGQTLKNAALRCVTRHLLYDSSTACFRGGNSNDKSINSQRELLDWFRLTNAFLPIHFSVPPEAKLAALSSELEQKWP